jgi:hypothetical protein
MYIKERDGAQLRCCLYVDDLLCTYPAAHINPAGTSMHLETIKSMQEKYDLDDDGFTDCTAFIGMNFTWVPWANGHHAQCAIDMTNELNALRVACDYELRGGTRNLHARSIQQYDPSRRAHIPEGPEGDAERKRVEDFVPRGFVGLALWIMRGYRPDIAYQVGALSRVAHCFNDKHIAAARHLLRYLRTTNDLQLVYKRNLESTSRQPEVWVDADYSPDCGGWADNHRSTSAWPVLSNNTALNWCSRRQQRMAQSSTESEYYAAADAVKEAARLRALHRDLGYVTGPITVWENNQSCIKQAANPCDREAQKHIDVRAH